MPAREAWHNVYEDFCILCKRVMVKIYEAFLFFYKPDCSYIYLVTLLLRNPKMIVFLDTISCLLFIDVRVLTLITIMRGFMST